MLDHQYILEKNRNVGGSLGRLMLLLRLLCAGSICGSLLEVTFKKSSMAYNNVPTCLQYPLAPALQVH